MIWPFLASDLGCAGGKPMAIDQWPGQWNALRSACESHGATDRWREGRLRPPRFQVAPPASEAAVRAVEEELGLALPPSFRRVLLRYSGSLDIAWQLPDNAAPPEEFRRI